MHDNISSPLFGTSRHEAWPASVSLPRGPNRGDWPEVAAGFADFVPSQGWHASVKNNDSVRRNTGSPTATCNNPNQSGTPANANLTKSIIRAARLRDLLASVEEFWRASGPDRVWWRRDARHRLAEWRRIYAIPERAAFQAAVARSRA